MSALQYHRCGVVQAVVRRYVCLLYTSIANAAVSLLGIGDGRYLPGLYEGFIAAALFAILPQGLLSAAKSDARRREASGSDYARTAVRSIRKQLDGAVLSVQTLCFTLSQAIESMKIKNDEEVAQVFDRAAGKVCLKCAVRGACWERDYISTYNCLNAVSYTHLAEVKRRIMLGTFALSAGYYDAYYKKAQQVRTLVIRDFARVLGEFDMILAPVAPTTAYRLGEKAGDPMQMYLGDIYTVPVNIAGLPALSMPTGHKDADGLPVGMQLIGRAFGEAELYRAGGAYEAERSAQIC